MTWMVASQESPEGALAYLANTEAMAALSCGALKTTIEQLEAAQ